LDSPWPGDKVHEKTEGASSDSKEKDAAADADALLCGLPGAGPAADAARARPALDYEKLYRHAARH
jgi:hypothetical protein